MKQSKIIKKTYKACMDHDLVKQKSLFLLELKKIFKRKLKDKLFSTKWTVL